MAATMFSQKFRRSANQRPRQLGSESNIPGNDSTISPEVAAGLVELGRQGIGAIAGALNPPSKPAPKPDNTVRNVVIGGVVVIAAVILYKKVL